MVNFFKANKHVNYFPYLPSYHQWEIQPKVIPTLLHIGQEFKPAVLASLVFSCHVIQSVHFWLTQ